MQRPITGYGTDAHGEPFAWLSCGHRQHVRHQPPFVNRAWVMSEAGRESMLGHRLDCVRCDALEWPDGFVAYKQTPEFTELTIPTGLLKDHSTKRGVWARIRVCAGRLHYRIPSLGLDQLLDAHTPGTVLPEVLHSVAPLGAVRFFVEFHQRAADA